MSIIYIRFIFVDFFFYSCAINIELKKMCSFFVQLSLFLDGIIYKKKNNRSGCLSTLLADVAIYRTISSMLNKSYKVGVKNVMNDQSGRHIPTTNNDSI